MLINHMRERSYALEDGIDSSLHEWSDNRLPPLRLGVQNNQDEGRHITLPSISPYSMDFFPQYEIQTGVQNNQDEGQQITLPSISPYSMDCFPQYEIQTGAHPHEVRAYSSDERHEFEQVFQSVEENQTQELSPTNESDLEISSPHQNIQLPQIQQQGSSSSSTEHDSQQSIYSAAVNYEAELAAVNGIVSPCKRGPGQKPLQPSDIPLGTKRQITCFCPLCGTGYAQKVEVRSHFVACVDRNGNPNGAYWDEGLGTGQSLASLQSDRMKRIDAAFYAVNGVFSPSKLAPEEPPKTLRSHAKDTTPLVVTCSLCRGRFPRSSHVKSHFPACVARNGNPDGLTWDEGWPVPGRARPRTARGRRRGGDLDVARGHIDALG